MSCCLEKVRVGILAIKHLANFLANKHTKTGDQSQTSGIWLVLLETKLNSTKNAWDLRLVIILRYFILGHDDSNYGHFQILLPPDMWFCFNSIPWKYEIRSTTTDSECQTFCESQEKKCLWLSQHTNSHNTYSFGTRRWMLAFFFWIQRTITVHRGHT